ncbi:MAG TPA: tetratricopeptide repeat protein [Luteitalea sp.]|nr:tetratricopeptide repeat protein [Luteitalea sp.]
MTGRGWVGAALVLLAAARGVDAQTDRRATEAAHRAEALAARGDAGGALALLWTASGLAPGDADIQMRLASALERVGALDAAIDAWRLALAARAGDRKATRGLVLALVAAGRSPDAVVLARAGVEAAPKDVEALVTLGLAQSEQDVAAALETMQAALARAPDHTLARYNLALLLKRVDRVDEAITHLNRMIAREPRPEAYYALGVAAWHRGDAARATEALEAAIASDPTSPDAHHMLGAVRASARDWSGATASLRRALALRPQAETHDVLARVLRAAGDEAGARTHRTEAERLRLTAAREHEARVWTSLGTGRLEQGDAMGALDALRKAVAVDATYAPAHFQTGRTLDRLGEASAADDAYRRAQRLNPRLVAPPREARPARP